MATRLCWRKRRRMLQQRAPGTSATPSSDLVQPLHRSVSHSCPAHSPGALQSCNSLHKGTRAKCWGSHAQDRASKYNIADKHTSCPMKPCMHACHCIDGKGLHAHNHAPVSDKQACDLTSAHVARLSHSVKALHLLRALCNSRWVA